MGYSPPGSSIYGISRQEHWMGLPFPSPGDLPNPEIELKSPSLQIGSLSASLVAQGKESACNVGHLGSISGLEKIPWRREWLPTAVFWPGVYGVSKSWTQLNDFHFTTVIM